MADQGEHYGKSWILNHILDRMIGSRELVNIRRKRRLIQENERINNEREYLICNTGSMSEGFDMEGSDVDVMFIDRKMEVMCSNQDTNSTADNRDKTIAIMRKADCRSCYVTLELLQEGRHFDHDMMKSLVPVRDRLFISSEINAKLFQERAIAMTGIELETHGPSSVMKSECSGGSCDTDFVLSYSCTGWPPEANEWLRRPRHHGWPKEALIFDISQSGCHVVPVGDKTSADTFLQWRISFATAERRLIHSLSHEQFLVYGLLKLFLKQISEILKRILEDEEILSSYIMKTVIFFAVENAPNHVWKEQNTFLCFRLCLKILIVWVNAKYCPNYFIVSNNMFQGKLQGGKQETLLRFLMEMYNMKWACLSVGKFIKPSIGVRIQRVIDGHWEEILVSPKILEYECDRALLSGIWQPKGKEYVGLLALLTKSESDIDEFISYFLSVTALSCKAMNMFEEQQTERGNKQKYKSLRKCKNFMAPFASACTSPGLLTLATFYYQTGNYMKALMACGKMLSSFTLFLETNSYKDIAKYIDLYCGRRYTLLQKCREALISNVKLYKDTSLFCPSQLHHELMEFFAGVTIPPLPYAMFLSFLCYHELGDMRRRDTALTQLRAVKYDVYQGRSVYWIVNNLLGICYEMVGDTQRAIREYQESLSGAKCRKQFNPAKEKIARLQQSPMETS